MALCKTRGRLGSAVPSIALLLLLTFAGLGNASAATTHYISKSTGSDSNSGTAKTSAWAHLPGMPSCTANCASYTPGAGDQFILMGGDTWGTSDLKISWSWNGTSGSRIYIGVDQTWFAGSSWTRPKFDCQNTDCSSDNILWIPGNYTTFDNIELTGYEQSGGGNKLVWVYGNFDEIENLYIHGWSRTSTISNSYAITNDTSGGFGQGTSVHDNVIDGSDSPNKDFMGGILHGDKVYNNVIRYVYNGMLGTFTDIHGNLVENNFESPTGDHCNGIFEFGPNTGNAIFMYGNIVRHTSTNSCVNFWVKGLGNPNASTVAYVFNNVLYDLNAGNVLNIGDHPAGNYGTFYVFNNTVQCGSDSNTCDWPSNWNGGPFYTGHFVNNHWIANSQYYCPVGSTCNYTPQLVQSVSQANNAGFAGAQAYAFSPTSAGSPTVGQGTNLQAYCTALGTLNAAAGTACQSDTTFATYDTVNHRVVMRTVHSRGSTWDIGAYQFAQGQQSPPPNPPALPSPPTNLRGVVQ